MSSKRSLSSERTQVPELQDGDKICKLKKNGVLKFGSVIKYGEIRRRDLKRAEQKDPRLKILWNGEREKERIVAKAAYQVYDRIFFVGQEVQCGARIGRVIASHQLANVALWNNEILASPIPTDDLSPLTKIFKGVHVELNGWIGVIDTIRRNISVELNEPFKNRICRVLRSEPFRRKYGRKRSLRCVRRYPFVMRNDSTTYLPFEGNVIEFDIEELEKKGTWTGRNPLRRFRGDRPSKVSGRVLDSKIERFYVDWIKRIPCVPNVQSQPPERLEEDDLRKLRFFYIDPVAFMGSNGFCNVDIQPDAITMEQAEFSQHFSNLLRGNEDNQDKRAKLELEETYNEHGQTRVTNWFSFHLYEVKIHQTNQIEFIYGRDLLPLERNEDFSVQKTQFPGILYVTKFGNEAKNNDYGIVLDMKIEGLDTICEVQWMTLVGNEIHEQEVTSVTRKAISIHTKYNDLRPGVIVQKSSYENKVGFEFGTIVKLDRYNYGKAQVYCPKFEVKKQLWPHQLEVLKLDVPQISTISAHK